MVLCEFPNDERSNTPRLSRHGTRPRARDELAGERRARGPCPPRATAPGAADVTSGGARNNARHWLRDQTGGTAPPTRSVVVPSAPHGVPRSAEQEEDQTHYEHDDADRPENRNPGDETDDEKYDAESDHSPLLVKFGDKVLPELRSFHAGACQMLQRVPWAGHRLRALA
jgi:hypothetical protein